MKTIIKSEAAACLKVAKNKGWNWDEFHKNDQSGYKDCLTQGLNEQNNECAYTGLWLGEGTKQTVHIDHFRKKAIYPELTFEWENLFVAAKDPDFGADFKDRTIHGPLKYSEPIYKDILSPLDANLSKYLWYRQDGMIVANPEINDDSIILKIQHTIEIFNLNSTILKNRRSKIIRQIKDLHGCDAADIKEWMRNSGFSFVVDLELDMNEQQIRCNIARLKDGF